MNDLAYSGINTTVRILEQQLLSKDIMNSLLASKELQQALEVLQKTAYGFQTDELLQTKQFDAVLMKHLKNQYEELYELIPTPELLDIFSIRYTYHNLKVLLKEKFAKKDFSHLLIPIGRYSLVTLKQKVGFVLQQSGIEYNYLFDALLKDLKQEYSPELAKKAFER